MKVVNANNARERVVGQIREFLKEEDTGFIASNSFNFPIVEDGEEGFAAGADDFGAWLFHPLGPCRQLR